MFFSLLHTHSVHCRSSSQFEAFLYGMYLVLLNRSTFIELQIGIYTVLYFLCLYILIRRRQSLHWILPVLATAMFAIATADMGYMTYILFGHLLKGALTFQHMRPKYWLYVTNK
jgi:hypothetical protein